MWRFLIQRLAQSVVVVVGAAAVVFFVVRLTGDPARLMLPMDAGTEAIDAYRRELGLDDSLPVQYWRFLGRLSQGDLGVSLRHHQPALNLVIDRLPATLELAFSGMLVAMAVAVPAGILSAAKGGGFFELGAMALALTGQAVPVFWLGILLILIFGVRLHALPVFGYGDLAHLVLPAVTVGTYSAAVLTRLLRSSMLEVLGEDYIRVARAKGLTPRRIILRHALKNGLIPLVTAIGLQLGALMGGAVVTETIFAWPGVGRLAIQSIYNRDFPVVQAVVVVVVLLLVAVNLVVDLCYRAIDPRIRV